MAMNIDLLQGLQLIMIAQFTYKYLNKFERLTLYFNPQYTNLNIAKTFFMQFGNYKQEKIINSPY